MVIGSLKRGVRPPHDKHVWRDLDIIATLLSHS